MISLVLTHVRAVKVFGINMTKLEVAVNNVETQKPPNNLHNYV
ncbi:MAG: hypothetical protein NZ919_01600 [Candidatus Caldarchaeum sp.]|nr:hypothetical protein [Candidatus Caldarchaeum sp.]